MANALVKVLENYSDLTEALRFSSISSLTLFIEVKPVHLFRNEKNEK